jgi:hypothetical protein
MSKQKAALSRREWTAAVIATAPLFAQDAGKPPTAAPEELDGARANGQRNRDRLRSFKVPITTEPAFGFRP